MSRRILVCAVLLLSACTQERTVLSEKQFNALKPFDATVVSTEKLEFEPGVRYHSAALNPYRLTVELPDGSLLVVDSVLRDANWPWAVKSLVARETYRFPKALYENHHHRSESLGK